MKNRKKVIYVLLSVIAMLFPIGFLMGIINAKTAFPIIFILLGCQQLFNGFFLVSKDNKSLRFISVILGSFFLLFGLLVVFPKYYL